MNIFHINKTILMITAKHSLLIVGGQNFFLGMLSLSGTSNLTVL